MGLLRVALAMAVLFGHCGGLNGYRITYSSVAVQCFYIISGFYMSMILNEKYKGGNAIFLFYSNRFYRLMPLYLFILIISICASFIMLKLNRLSYPSTAVSMNAFIKYFYTLDFKTLAYILFSNVFLIGHDLCAFLGIDPIDGTMFFTSNWETTKPPMVGSFFFIPQSWTVSLEIYFYLLAPFLVSRKMKYITILLIATFILRVYLYSLGYHFGFWEYGFFPMELGFFLLGTISYRLYKLLEVKKVFNNINSSLLSIVILSFTFFYQYFPVSYSSPLPFLNDRQILYYFSVTIGLPFLFYTTNRNKIDRFIGELSYPIYLSHLIIASFFIPIKSSFYIYHIMFFTIIFSVFSVIIIQKPVDKFRHSRLRSENNPGHS